MLDAAHRLALGNVAQGVATAEDAAAVRGLAIAGLIEPVDGAWRLTQTGYAVLELEGDAAGAGGSDVVSKIRDWFMT